MYDSSNLLFLKTVWNTTWMGYILIQLDNSQALDKALAKLLSTGECDVELSHSGARLQHIVFDSCTCTEIEKHYSGSVEEVACGRWENTTEKRHI